MWIFDTHAHYDDSAFDEDREAVLSSLEGEGVRRVVDVAASVRSLDRVCALASGHPQVYAAVGLHPDEIGTHSRAALEGRTYRDAKGEERPVEGLTPAVMEKLEMLLTEPKVVAVGEIGLDYHWDTEAHALQIDCFRQQIDLALRAGKPILVHSRAAAEDTLRVIEEKYGSSHFPENGVIHAYAYSLEQARIYTELGFCLGIGGVVTYKNSKKLKKVVSEIPLERLLLETDCPYLTPEPRRGERNDSRMLHYVVQAIAELKDVSPETVMRQTFENACRLFSLPL